MRHGARAKENTLTVPVNGVFIAIGLHPNVALLSHLLELSARGEIVVSGDCATSHAGIFAPGDVSYAFGKRIIIAYGEGAKASMAARQYVREERKNRQVADNNPGTNV